MSRPDGGAESGTPYVFGGDEPAFREPWEAQAFAIAVRLSERGVFTWPQFADVLAEVIADPPSAHLRYYEQWLAALERLVTTHRLVDARELVARREAWRDAALATPHGQAIVLPTRRLGGEANR